MNDKKLEQEIKKTEEFLEYWQKLLGLYNETVLKCKSSSVDIDVFLCSKEMISEKFENWMDILSFSTKDRVTKACFFYEIFSVKDMHGFSDEKIKKIEKAWKDSFSFISQRLDKAKKKKKRLEKINGFFYKVKKIFNRGGRS